MKHIYLLLFCMVFLPFMTRAQVYTLEECLTAALEKNNKIKNSLLEMEMARQTRKEAVTFYFPQVSASGKEFQMYLYLSLKKEYSRQPQPYNLFSPDCKSSMATSWQN